MSYSSGIVVKLTLHLSNMQIELRSYSFDGTKTHSKSSSSSSSSKVSNMVYQKTSDGFNIISDFTTNQRILDINNFLGEVSELKMSEFRLIGAEFIQNPIVLYRLKYRLPSLNIVQTVYVESLGQNSFRVIESNYSSTSLSEFGAMQSINPLNILDNVWLHKINNIILEQYS